MITNVQVKSVVEQGGRLDVTVVADEGGKQGVERHYYVSFTNARADLIAQIQAANAREAAADAVKIDLAPGTSIDISVKTDEAAQA